MRYARTATVLILGSAIFASCQCEQTTPAVPTAPGNDFSERPGANHTPVKLAAATATRVQVAAAATPTIPTDLKMPDDFPKDLPIFKDAQLSQVQELPSSAHNVIMRVNAPVKDITRYYNDELTKAKWENTQMAEQAQHSFMTYKKGNMIANVTIAEDASNPGQKIIAIMYYEEKPLDFEEF